MHLKHNTIELTREKQSQELCIYQPACHIYPTTFNITSIILKKNHFHV